METLTEKDFTPLAPTAGPRIVKFINFSNEDFTWTWNNIPYTFKAGEYKYMEGSLANHFAKHLVNRELLKENRENDTSPSKPAENPFFMALFNKAIEPIETGTMDETKAEMEALDRTMKEKEKKAPIKSKKKEPEFEELNPPEDGSDE